MLSTSSPRIYRLLIAEDHELIIQGVLNLLSNQPDYQIVGTVTDGLGVMQACREYAPDLLLLDLGLPGMDGIDVISQVNRRYPEIMIVVLTAVGEEYRARDAWAAGAMGYVLKRSPHETLLSALDSVTKGKRFLDPSLDISQCHIDGNDRSTQTLTMRERQVLKLIAEGCRNRDVAEHLNISLKTVETHRLNLMRKLDAHNIAELVNWARRLGLL